MKLKNALLTAALLAATSLGVAHAQNSGTSTGDRQTQPATGGQMSTPNQDKGTAPRAGTESRAAVKADTAAAKAAASVPQGQQSTAMQGKGETKPMPSTESRAAVKSDAAAANKAGATKGGQESVKDQNKGGVPKQ